MIIPNTDDNMVPMITELMNDNPIMNAYKNSENAIIENNNALTHNNVIRIK